MLKKEKPLTSMTKSVSYLLIFLPVAVAFLYVREFGVNVPYWDDWVIVRLLDELAAGTLSVSDLWSQHNEHRMFFPLTAMLLLGSVTKFNTVAEMYLSQGFIVITLFVLLLAFKRSTNAPVLFFVPISFLLLNLRQYENMLWGWQVDFVMAGTFGVMTLYSLYVLSTKGFGKTAFSLALVSATVASFSQTQGLLVWPAGLLQLFISPIERSAKKYLIGVWTLLGLGEWIVYFVGWTKPDNGRTLSYVLDYPVAAIEYFLTLFGASLFWQQDLAFVGGLLLTGLAIASLLLVYRDRKLGECSFWVALLFFAFSVMAIVALGRSQSGAAWAILSARHAAFTILAVISVYAMLIKFVLDKRSRIATVLIGVLSVLILFGVPVSYSEGIEAGEATRASRERAAFILSTYESQPDELLMEHLYPSPGGGTVVRERAGILEEFGYSVFS